VLSLDEIPCSYVKKHRLLSAVLRYIHSYNSILEFKRRLLHDQVYLIDAARAGRYALRLPYVLVPTLIV